MHFHTQLWLLLVSSNAYHLLKVHMSSSNKNPYNMAEQKSGQGEQQLLLLAETVHEGEESVNGGVEEMASG